MATMTTKRGELSAYALACGYVQTVGGVREFTQSEAYLYAEGDCYHVRRPLDEGEVYHLPMGWDSYATLGEARRALRKYGRLTDHRD